MVAIMNGDVLLHARKRRCWTQTQAAVQLGVSQAYVALLEKGHRAVPAKLARQAVRLFQLSPALLPPAEKHLPVTNDELVRDLSRLGYPGFAHVRGGRLKNPGEILLAALAQPTLDSRVAEALPWLLLRYPELDSDWLVRQARLTSLTNRLGFVVDLARRVLERECEMDSPRYRVLTHLLGRLRQSRLDVEDTFCQESLSESERNWMRANRPIDAQFWHLLTNWQPEFLQYTH